MGFPETLSWGLGIIGALVAGGIFFAFRCKPEQELQSLMDHDHLSLRRKKRPSDPVKEEDETERIKRMAVRVKEEREKEDISRKLYKAGYYNDNHRKYFLVAQIASIIICPIVVYLIVRNFFGNDFLSVMMVVLGVFIGFTFPIAWLERQGRIRAEDSMYYLPMVIEQISIGVSGSLDIGPCLSQIVETAHERDSHNPITEMFIHVERLIRSGLNLEDSLVEVGDASGLNEVKHAFMFLAQCSKHGGEVSRQLQELADAVMVERQVQVEGRIAALPAKATGPLATVFAGFFGLLLAGLFVQLAGAFG